MKELVADRVAMIRKANPEQTDKKVPVDLVTCSGSGLDPGISVAAAEYQIPRLVKTTGKSEAELRKIVDKYTVHKFSWNLWRGVCQCTESKPCPGRNFWK